MRKVTVFWTSPAEAILAITGILFVLGLVNVFSASFVLANQLLNDSYFFLKRQLMYFGLGLVGMVFALRYNYHKYKKHQELLIIIMIGLLLAVHFSGVDANGARRWLKLGVKFQPSELAKLIVIIFTACYLGPRIDRLRTVSLGSWPVGVTIFIGALVLRQPDMGTASVIVGLCGVMYILAGIPKKEQMGLLVVVATGIVYLTFAAAYRAERISAWLDPWAYKQTTGYQTVQGLLAIGSGGFWGNGLGMGASKFYYLPEAHTDFAFAVLCQEMGFLGASIVLILLGSFAVYGVKIALKANDGLGTMLAMGITILIVGQAVGNIAMVSGLIPVTGVPLPFISYGGTSLVVNLTAIGILINIARCSKIKEDKKGSGSEEPRKGTSKLRLIRARGG